MPFNLEEFKSELSYKSSVQKTSKFLVQFTAPRIMLSYNTDVIRTMRFWATNVSLPGYGFATNEVRRYTYGPAEKRPFGPAFVDLSMSIIADADHDNWDYFHRWMEAILPHDTRFGIDSTGTPVNGLPEKSRLNARSAPYELEYRENYVTDIQIVLYNEQGQYTNELVCTQAFPIAAGDIDYSWQDNNKIALIPITMTYVDWYYTRTKTAELDQPSGVAGPASELT